MSSTAKTLLVIAAVLLGIALLIVGGAWYWWHQNSAALLAAGDATMTEGQKVGAGLDENGCMAAAFTRHKADGSKSITAALRNSLWLNACLDASKVTDKFCEGVPVPHDVVATGTWAGTSCVRQGISDPYCGTLFGIVPKYCASDPRANKLKTNSQTRPPG